MITQGMQRSVYRNIAGLILVILASVAGIARGQELADRAAVIKPTAKELTWLKIPWVLDFKAAQNTAKLESRPIFLWVTGDDPLERC
jgi:hypothetical protein